MAVFFSGGVVVDANLKKVVKRSILREIFQARQPGTHKVPFN